MMSENPQFSNEYENACIIDYRDPENPNNTVLVTCEHATNELPEDYSWTEHDKRVFVNEHWGSDIGAFQMANALAAELKCVFVHTLYSRLLLDCNRSIVSETLFRKSGDGYEVDLNKGMTHEEEQKRIKRFFIPYYDALREISLKVNPQFILSIHSFTRVYQGEPRAMEIGVLYGHDSTEFATALNDGYNESGYLSALNKPYDGITCMGAIKSLIYAQHPTTRQGVTFEFRNDILSDKARSEELKKCTLDIVRDVCKV